MIFSKSHIRHLENVKVVLPSVALSMLAKHRPMEGNMPDKQYKAPSKTRTRERPHARQTIQGTACFYWVIKIYGVQALSARGRLGGANVRPKHEKFMVNDVVYMVNITHTNFHVNPSWYDRDALRNAPGKITENYPQILNFVIATCFIYIKKEPCKSLCQSDLIWPRFPT